MRAGRFDLSQSATLDELGEMNEPASKLLPLEEAVSHLPVMELTEERVARTRDGLATQVAGLDLAEGRAVRMVSGTGELIAIGTYDATENAVRPKVVLV